MPPERQIGISGSRSYNEFMCKATHTSNINVSMSGKTLYLKQSKFVTAMPYHKPSSPNKNELYNNVIDLIREFKLERAGSGF